MRQKAIAAAVRVLVVGWAVPLIAQGPCEQITAACRSAGFAQGEAKNGTGLQSDCVVPIMQGIAQPAAATRPLPHITPEVIAACKKNKPDFGQQKNIDLPSFQVGASNPVNAGTPKAIKQGNDSAVLNEIDGSHPGSPAYAGPPIAVPPNAAETGAGAAPHKFRLVVWTNDKPTVLLGVSGVTGQGGAALPTPAQVRAQAQMVQRPPGVVIIHAQSGSPASKALPQLGACDAPACVVEIDKLGANGQVVQTYRFAGGQAVVRSGTGAQPRESVSLTYRKLNVSYVQQGAGTDSASFGWP